MFNLMFSHAEQNCNDESLTSQVSMSRVVGLEIAALTDAKPTEGGCTVRPDLRS